MYKKITLIAASIALVVAFISFIFAIRSAIPRSDNYTRNVKIINEQLSTAAEKRQKARISSQEEKEVKSPRGGIETFEIW